MIDTIRVLAVDDHALIRRGLRSLLELADGIDFVGEAADGYDAVIKARTLQPDVILLDLVMSGKDGIETMNDILAQNLEVSILVLTSFTEDEKIFAAIKAGALGYITKDSSPEELIQAIRDVHQGIPSLEPDITRRVLWEIGRPEDSPSPPKQLLTNRETDVLKLVASGLSNQNIADKLSITEGTVRYHVTNIFDKLQLTNRTQAALYALREGLISLD